MTRRTGIPSIIQTGKLLCKFITNYTSVILLLFPENEDLAAALASANVACAALVAILGPLRDVENTSA